jgi:hypothetical protein
MIRLGALAEELLPRPPCAGASGQGGGCSGPGFSTGWVESIHLVVKLRGEPYS